MADAARARSGNPAVRATGTDAEIVSLEQEAEDAPITFEFKGETWEVQDDYRPLRFQRLMERSLLSEALSQALGEEQYEELEDVVTSLSEVEDACKALAEALVPGGAEGNSRASRRSSARKRPARR